MQFEATRPAAGAAASASAPNVAYFANQFADRAGHGLARYARELFTALRGLNGPNIIPVAGWSSLPPDAFAQRAAETGLRLTGLGRRGTSLLWTFLDWPPIETRLELPVDVVHAVSLGYPVATRKPLAVTIHDLGPLTHPEYFRNTRPWVMQRSLDQAVRKADVIVCVSQTTADEVRSYVGPAIEGRLRVVPEGVSEAFFEPADMSLLQALPGVPGGVPIILSAGHISPRKNIQGLLRAFALAKGEIPHHLVLVGGLGWDHEELQQELVSPGLKERVHLAGFVSDAELRALYQAADLYVHPSLYEGFGLPVLEAMASGTPVLASNRSSLPEVAGSAGRLTDTTVPEVFAADLAGICLSRPARDQMAAAGLAHARRYRWADCARAMEQIYAELAP
ncbi:glycosyltransferase family 4 protein [Leisingera sp. McT4-56]|uniref:glycosyltransferase family 4 protein n=1 Tax=Leisingera sp. McT4-56 TaxID=2881255 RepID=UPI001CF8DD4F|nr:glycosyltransferase family 1 protein [Leisingera sp. McT4-56]MCB4458429.1 glycosyltransferase family 4 protein [Leisingera sp. McT4-56]